MVTRFNVIACLMMDSKDLSHIFTTKVSISFKNYSEGVQKIIPSLIDSSLKLFG